MKIYHLVFCGYCAFFLSLGSNVIAEETVYYRYINEKGVNVISSRIPSEYVKQGYEIVTFDGRLIERVAPEPSADEKARIVKQLEEQQRLEAWDKELLKRYSHPDDIEAAKQRKLLQNKNAIGIAERNLEKIEEEINRYQSLAAADERQGRDVSADTLEKIAQLKREKELEDIEKQKLIQGNEAMVNSYNKDIERFKVIRPNTAVISRP